MRYATYTRAKIVPRTLALAVFASGVLAITSSTVLAGSPTPSSVIRSTKLAIGKELSAHVVFVAHSGSPSKAVEIVADVGRESGTETVTAGKASVIVELTPAHAYVSGNAAGLTEIYGMSSTDAKKVGKDWESFKAGTSQYTNFKSDLTLSSVSALLPKAKGARLSSTGTGTALSYVLQWTIAATSSLPRVTNTFTIASGATTLPVKEIAVVATGGTATTTLSNWGEQVSVSAPPSSATIASSKISG